MSVQQLGFAITAPTALTAVAGTATGALDTSAVYQYKVTYVSGFGETGAGANASVTTTSTGSVNLSNIPVWGDANVIARKIYRTVGGGSTWLLLTTINDNVTTTYVDLIADGSLGGAAPTLNTANSVQNFVGVVQVSDNIFVDVENGITATAGGAQVGAYALSKRISVLTTVATTNDSVILPELGSIYVGRQMSIKNNGANTARIYPFIGQQINSGGANVPITLAAGSSVNLVANLATNWISI